MTTSRRSLCALALLVFVGGCQQDPNIPTLGSPEITLTLSVSRTSMRPGDPDTIRVVARNTLPQRVELISGSRCFFFVTVRNASGTLVAPRDGPTGCVPVRTVLQIPAGGTSTFVTVWTGGFDFLPNDTQAKVPPGEYFVAAALIATNYSTIAPSFKVTVTN